MYLEHFGLRELPFSLAPDPRYLYLSAQHREALAHLLYGVRSEGGFVQLTGEVGTGKTTVCRCFLEQLPPGTKAAVILNPRLTAGELLAAVCDEFEIPEGDAPATLKGSLDRINRFLLELHAGGGRAVLIVDEAQNLEPGVLEQVRLLTNLETSRHKLLQIILMGQPELRETLARPELRQIAQRITARFHLGSLSRADAAGYVRHRLQVAGCVEPLFPPEVLGPLFRLSRGVPRMLNILCDRALLGAFVQGKRQVDRATLRQAAREIAGEGDTTAWLAALRGRERAAGAAAALLIASLAGALAYRAIAPRGAPPAPAPVPSQGRAVSPKPPGISTVPGHGALGDRALPPASTSSIPAAPSPGRAVSPKPPGTGTLPGNGALGDRALPPASTSSIPAAPSPGRAVSPKPPGTGTIPGTGALGDRALPPEGTPAAPQGRAVSPKPPGTGTIPDTGALGDRALPPAPAASAEETAFRALFDLWGVPWRSGAGNPCAQALAHGLVCFRGGGGLAQLRRLDRPAVLTLADPTGGARFALLVGLDGERAILAAGGGTTEEEAAALTGRMTGEFTLLWRMPGAGSAVIAPGDRGPAVAWLRRNLARDEGAPPPAAGEAAVYGPETAAAVRRFQAAAGIAVDGVAGPETLILLDVEPGPGTPTLRRP